MFSILYVVFYNFSYPNTTYWITRMEIPYPLISHASRLDGFLIAYRIYFLMSLTIPATVILKIHTQFRALCEISFAAYSGASPNHLRDNLHEISLFLIFNFGHHISNDNICICSCNAIDICYNSDESFWILNDTNINEITISKKMRSMPRKLWDETTLTNPFPNWKWISNFTPHFIMDVISYPFQD